MVHQGGDKKIHDILLMAGAIWIFAVTIIPHGALGGCDTDATNYTLCLQNHSADISFCACCVVNQTGSLSTLCNDRANGCAKPIGVAILQNGTSPITLTGDPTHRVVPSSQYEYPNSCNVGILANNLLHTGVKNIQIQNMIVEKWANAIMMWRIQDQGAILGSSIRGNGNGIYLFNSGKNTIHTNTLENNVNYGIVLETNQNPPYGPDKTFNNIIYNNNFLDSNKAFFIDQRQNQWNITPISGTNIIGGDYIGGNYWAGYSDSETCICDSQGFCTIPYNVGAGGTTNNIDQKPLCPKLSIMVSPASFVWDLHPNEINTLPTAVTVQIESGGSWNLVLNPTHYGYLYSPTVGELINPMKIGSNSEGWSPVYGFTKSGSGNWIKIYGLQQPVVDGDPAASDYSISLEFVAIPGV